VLQDNGGDSLAVPANGTFTFPASVASGGNYAVTVLAQPTGERCVVSNGSGTVGSANVTGVLVACAVLPANVRLINTSNATLGLSISGGYSLSGVAPASASAYAALPGGVYTASVYGSGVAGAPFVTIGLAAGQNYSSLAFVRNATVYSAFFAESLPSPAAGLATLEVANVSPDPGPLDVYVVPSGTAAPTAGAASFSSVTGISSAAIFSSANASASPPDNWEIVATAAGVPGDIRLTLPSVYLASGQAYTLGLTGTGSGALVNAVLIPQGIALTSSAFHPATQARVRVLSALPQTAQVNVSAGTTPLPAIFAPVPTGYALVAGAASISAISVTPSGGAPFSPTTLPPDTFAAGGDYTVLLYGDGTTAAGTMAAVLTDTNQLLASYASIRLINGAVSAGPATMYVNGTQTSGSAAYGTGSTYSGVGPTSSATIQVTDGPYSNTATSINLAGGGVYSVFVYSSAAAPVIVKDR
jgi:hypothetical protein